MSFLMKTGEKESPTTSGQGEPGSPLPYGTGSELVPYLKGGWKEHWTNRFLSVLVFSYMAGWAFGFTRNALRGWVVRPWRMFKRRELLTERFTRWTSDNTRFTPDLTLRATALAHIQSWRYVWTMVWRTYYRRRHRVGFDNFSRFFRRHRRFGRRASIRWLKRGVYFTLLEGMITFSRDQFDIYSFFLPVWLMATRRLLRRGKKNRSRLFRYSGVMSLAWGTVLWDQHNGGRIPLSEVVGPLTLINRGLRFLGFQGNLDYPDFIWRFFEPEYLETKPRPVAAKAIEDPSRRPEDDALLLPPLTKVMVTSGSLTRPVADNATTTTATSGSR